MAVYMVERDLKGISMEDLAGAQKAVMARTEEMRQAGGDVRYIRSVFAPEDGRCMCLFEASDPEGIAAVNRELGIPFNRIVPALDLTPA